MSFEVSDMVWSNDNNCPCSVGRGNEGKDGAGTPASCGPDEGGANLPVCCGDIPSSGSPSAIPVSVKGTPCKGNPDAYWYFDETGSKLTIAGSGPIEGAEEWKKAEEEVTIADGITSV